MYGSLWIAFRIVFLLMIPNWAVPKIRGLTVVNCFQNCIFTYDSQRFIPKDGVKGCCELLSELYFYLWFPTLKLKNKMYGSLWIAFRIVFLLMIPNAEPFSSLTDSVVNCFQNCIFTYDSQRNWFMGLYCNCCELLSELYFYLWFPPKRFRLNGWLCCELLSELYFYLWFPTFFLFFLQHSLLWIAFRIVFLLMIPNVFSII